MLRILAFDHSLQPNIVSSASTGKVLIANHAACELFGYSEKEMLTKSRKNIFDIRERSFKKMLEERTAEGHSTAVVTAIKKNGEPVPVQITSAVFMGEHGTKKLITTISDMREEISKQQNVDARNQKMVAANVLHATAAQKKVDLKNERITRENTRLALLKSNTRFAANNEWIKYIAKTSYDVMWDWDIKSGKIYVGKSIEEVFGYKLKNDTTTFGEFASCLLPEEKETVKHKLLKTLSCIEKSWNDSFKLVRCDGTIASTVSRASIVRDDKGKCVRLIGAIQDVSKLQELEKKLQSQISIQEELAEVFIVAAKLSFDGIWDWNLVTNEFHLGAGFEELFGYKIKKITGNMSADWSAHVHEEDREAAQKGLQDAIQSSACYWEQSYRFIKADGSVAKVFNRASIIRNSDGGACRVIGAMQDISKQKVLEEQLEQHIRLKEKQIADAMQEASNTARSEIGKELHDNITQLLGASKMYLEMAKKEDQDTHMYLSRASEYTENAIEDIRKLTRGLTTDLISNVGLYEAVDSMIHDTMQVDRIKISCTLKGFKEDQVSHKFKLNLFRIIQEQLNNILKHAQATRVKITITQSRKSLILNIADNGVGFDTKVKQKGIGLANIKSRATAFNGTAAFDSKPGHGCILTVNFLIDDLS
jgi:PAS domain S-box-containing protein